MSKWTVTPETIGVVTRYRVHRTDNSESRGVWDYLTDASNLVSILNADDFLAEEDWIDDEIDELELLHI